MRVKTEYIICRGGCRIIVPAATLKLVRYVKQSDGCMLLNTACADEDGYERFQRVLLMLAPINDKGVYE